MNLIDLGWDSFFEHHFGKFGSQGFFPARVVQEHKQSYLVYSEPGELTAQVSGKLIHHASFRGYFPAVGDWVVVSARPKEGKATIHAVLPRKSSFSRKAVLSGGMPDSGGKTEEQVLAANMDTVFLVSGLDEEFNLRRIERYLAIAWESRAAPVIVLNKLDVCPDIKTRIREVKRIALGVPVHPVSATENKGLHAFDRYLSEGKTAAFLGSSGVGKSTIINSLLGEDRLKIAAVREYDKKGRHTTTCRELILLSTGGMVIDTPGLRELSVWNEEDGLKRTFDDIEKLAACCRFRDCRHQGEPGCAVQQAVEEGTLDAKRFQSYLKLKRELVHLAIRKDQRARLDAKKRWKDIAKWRRKIKKR
jgi:ribosome biogenesis GTPase